MIDSSDRLHPPIKKTITLEDGSSIQIVAALRGPQSPTIDMAVKVTPVAQEAWQEAPPPATLELSLVLGPLVDVLVKWEQDRLAQGAS